MPFVLIIAGIVLLTAAVRNTQQDLFGLLARDFTGPNNFFFWLLSIVVIGAVGYIPKMKPFSDGFLILVILGLFLGNKQNAGFFAQFQRQIGATQSATPVVSPTTSGTGSVTGGGVNIGGGGVTVTPPVVTLPGGVRVGGSRAV
jgi:hypothetical protein